jgi:F-type H+-transporting ATPase subunit a
MLEFRGFKSKIQRIFFVLIVQLFVVSAGFASDHNDSTSVSEGFNASEMIMHHVLDANEIHIFDGLSFPLPILLYTANGFDVFSYGQFLDAHHHPTLDYTSPSTGNTYRSNHGHLFQLNESGEEIAHSGWGVNDHSFVDFSITKNVVGIFIVLIVMFLVFLSSAKAYSKGIGRTSAPKGVQSFLEPMILFIRDEVARPSIGKKYERFMPFLLSIFFFIWIGNILGLIPFIGGLNITGNIAVTLVLATLTFIVTIFSGNKGFWMHIVQPPGVPAWLLPIMWPIEIIGVISKPIVLTLRLFANITAGHIIILSFTGLIFIFYNSSGAGVAYGVSVGSVLFSAFMLSLELLVAFLQAYVFTLLSAIYFGQAVEDHH